MTHIVIKISNLAVKYYNGSQLVKHIQWRLQHAIIFLNKISIFQRTVVWYIKKKLWKGKGKKIKNCIVKAKLKYKTKCREFITNLSNLQKRQENIKAQRINPWHWYKEAYVKTEKYSSKEKYIDKSILLQFWYR